jgi:hypothetical protein
VEHHVGLVDEGLAAFDAPALVDLRDSYDGAQRRREDRQ